jgi:hypothetical protein
MKKISRKLEHRLAAGGAIEDAQLDSLEEVVDGQFVADDQAAGRPCARHNYKGRSVASL